MFSTGFAELDSLLGGGVGAGAITDVYGAAGCGKTQLVKQIAVGCLARGARVSFVDTTGKFRADRVLEMIRTAHGASDSLENFYVLRTTSSAEQISALTRIESSRADLVIVDSCSDLFSFEYGREDQLGEKNSKFASYMSSLSRLALRMNVPVVITNMIREFDGVERENLQQVVRQFVHVRIRLSRGSGHYNANVTLPHGGGDVPYDIASAGLVYPYTQSQTI